MDPKTPAMEPLLLRIPEAARMLGICTRSLYHLAARGDLPIKHIGRAARISVDDIKKFAANLGTQKEVEK